MERVNIINNELRLLILEGETIEAPININDLQKYFNCQSKILKLHQYQSCVELLRSNSFSIILIDISSFAKDNDINSEEILSHICKLSGETIIIAISDKKSVSLALSAMSSGAHAHIAKPLDLRELITLINNLTYQYGKLKHKPKTSEMDCHMIGFANNNAQQNSNRMNMGSKNDINVKPMWQQEQIIIEEAILMFNGNVSNAAKALEISPSTIYRKRQCWEELSLSRVATGF